MGWIVSWYPLSDLSAVKTSLKIFKKLAQFTNLETGLFWTLKSSQSSPVKMLSEFILKIEKSILIDSLFLTDLQLNIILHRTEKIEKTIYIEALRVNIKDRQL